MKDKIIKKARRILQSTGFEVRKIEKIKINVDIKQMRKLLYFNRMFNLISSVEGDVVECGVGKGRSFLYLAFLIGEEGKRRKLWGFDSFQGFPQPTSEDKSIRNPKKGELGGITKEDIFNLLRGAGIDEKFINDKINIIEGFFENTLKIYGGGSIALLHIDADLYQSYKQVLEELFPKVVKGGMILFDEYNEPKFPGATKAVDEYFQNTDYKILRDETINKYYVIK